MAPICVDAGYSKGEIFRTIGDTGLLVCSALPEELNSMAVGGDVKETVMTVPFLLTYISNMIEDLGRKHASDGNKRFALSQPEAP